MTDVHTLSGAYALHALTGPEVAQFEQHVTRCAECAAEVRSLRETAARLAVAVAEPPPATLRRRVLAAVQEVRQAAPTRILPLPGTVAELRRTPWRTRLALSFTAAATAAAVTRGVLAFDARRDLDQARAAQQQLLTVLAAPDAETVRRPVTAGGTGTVVYSRSRGQLVFTSSGLPELPGGRVYELWLMGPDGPRPAGLLTRDRDGMTAPLFARALGGDQHIGLTVEPAGGSERPTTTPILFAELPRA
jgi:anti-sigma-K factor RskA